MRIRSAQPRDAQALGEVHVAAWQAAYRDLMPDAYLDGLSVDERVGVWEQVLARTPVEGVTRLVCVDQHDRPLGFAVSGPTAVAEEAVGVGEIYVLNVLPTAWGRGHGRQLLLASQDALREGGHKQAVLWVVDRNQRARAFYEREGWHYDEGGERFEEVYGMRVCEVRYRRDL
ncbi:N-acetyltransferase family protein [Egicoccus sp. AB-alg6-2]|uniref:GNAT family N-acetyltransferase n=1 Tax=Egicoccus sp. AB-alg6-2 TaxID=3242692 RepID=UPI00359CF94D